MFPVIEKKISMFFLLLRIIVEELNYKIQRNNGRYFKKKIKENVLRNF